MLTRRVGPPTAPVGVTGHEFGATEIVDITFDLTFVGSATTDATGSFATSIVVPRTAAPGYHAIVATGRSSGLTAQTTFLVRADWPTYQFDALNSGYNRFENQINPANVATLTALWSRPVSGTPAQPAVANGKLFVGTSTGSLFAFDALTGITKWVAAVGGSLRYSATISGNTVYVTSSTGTLNAYDALTGAFKWSQVGGYSFAPKVSRGSVFVSSTRGTVSSFNATTGSLQWSTVIGTEAVTGPTVAGGMVFAPDFTGGGQDSVHALDQTTGTVLWTTPLELNSEVSTPASAANGVVYVSTFKFAVEALNGTTGALLWEACPCQFEGNDEVTPAVAKGLVYGSGTDNIFGGGDVVALNATTGVQVWDSSIAIGNVIDSPAVANGVVFVNALGEAIYAYDAASGSTLASFADARSTPVVANGLVYVATLTRVEAFHLP